MPRKVGCGPLAVFLLVVVALILIGSNEAIGYYYAHCREMDIMDCLMNGLEDDKGPEEGTVVASGVYEYKGNSVTVTANIPLAGGTVTGSVSGTCEGSLKGTFSGQQNGVITASMSGVCSPFFVNIPASAEFTGTVNKSAKTVPVSFQGGGGGMTHADSMVLSYP